MTARNPLTIWFRRLCKYDHPYSSFADNNLSSYTQFELLPAAAVAVGTDKLFLANTGVNPVAPARSATGGVLLTTAAANLDATILTGVTATPFRQLLSATNTFRFQTTVRITTITALVVQVGFGQAPSATDPAAANSGTDSAEFFFDPGNVLSSGATVANWIMRSRGSSGTVTYSSTSIPIVAATDYDLAIEMTTGLKPKFYINGSLVSDSSTGAGSITLAATTQICQFGVRTTTGAKTLDIRYAKANRLIG